MDKQYPQVLSTKEDYEYVRQNFPREYWEKDFEELLSEGYSYKVLGIVPDEYFDKSNEELEKTRFNDEEFSKVLTPVPEKKATTLLNHQAEWESREITFDITMVRWNKKTYVVVFVPDPDSKIAKVGYTTDELIEILFPVENYEQEISNGIDYSKIDVDNMTDEEVMEALKKMGAEYNGKSETDSDGDSGAVRETDGVPNT